MEVSCPEATATEPEGPPQAKRNLKRKSSPISIEPTCTLSDSKRPCKLVSPDQPRRSNRLKIKLEQKLKQQQSPSTPSPIPTTSSIANQKRKRSIAKAEAVDNTKLPPKESSEPTSSSASSPQLPSSKRRRGKKSNSKQDSDSEKHLATTSNKTSVNKESRRRTRSSTSLSENLPDTQDKGSPPPSLLLIGKGKGKSKKKGHSSSRESKKELITSDPSSRSVYWSVIKGSPHSTMASKDKDGQPGPSGEGPDDKPPSSAEPGAESSSGADTPDPIDPFLGLINDEKRLRMMLETHNLPPSLPPHLLGSLGLRMPHIFQKSMSSSNNTKAHQLLKGLQCVKDESSQLQSCIEIGQLLVMGNEDTLSGFPVKETVPSLIHLLSMEHNFDMMVHACRALTYMMEALPRSSVVVADAIPILLEKLQVIQCMDVAEQALSALEILSRRHSKSILQAGGVNACLLYLDFFSIATQRSALSVAANCCLSVSGDEYQLVADSVPILTGRLQHQDKRSVESCCLCFSRLVDNFISNPTVLQEIASHGLLPNIQNLLVISPPVVTSSTFVMVVKMLSTLCSSCPSLAVDLLKLRFAETLKYLLVGSEEITLENLELNSRTPNETYEIVSLISELMPPLPKTGVFKIEEILVYNRRHFHHGLTTVQWEWQANNNTWKPYGKMENRLIEAAHMSNEEDINFDVNGQTYILDFAEMQQSNEETGTSRAVRRTTVDALIKRSQSSSETETNEDPRAHILLTNHDLCSRFMQALFGVLYEVFSNTAGPSVKHKCLKALLKMITYASPDILTDILHGLSVSSYLAAMLQSSDYRVVVGAIQMTSTLLQKQPNVFLIQFHREGVIHAMEGLKEVPLQALATPKKPDDPLKMSVSLSSAAREEIAGGAPRSESASDSPSSARRRFVDMFRRSRRQLRKSFSRSRSEDQGLTAGTPPLPIFTPLPPPPSIATPPQATIVTSGDQTVSTVKEQIRDWIHQQTSDFLSQWQSGVAGMTSDAGLDVVNTLQKVSEQLIANSTESLNAINELHSLLTDPTTSVSAFEFLHCNTPHKLHQLLSDGGSVILKHFLHTFMGLPEQGSDLSSWTPPSRPGFIILLQKLQGCLNQLEQFPVKLHDLPNRRSNQAMKFFNSHQIKCNLERHPSASGIQSWRGGMVRIDPLATLQAVERYLLMRRPEIGRKQDDAEGSESDVEDTLHHTTLTIPNKHQLEFLINDHIVPLSMTIYQAIRQFSSTGGYESEEDMSALGPPNIWIQTHTVHYRLISQSDIPMRPKRALSLPNTPVEPSAATKLYSHSTVSVGGVRTRRQHAAMKPPLPLTPTTIASRMTRSTSKEKALVQDTEQKTVTKKQSPLFVAIQKTKDNALTLDDPSLPVINLLRLLWALNSHWNDLYNGIAGSPIVPPSEFISSKLSAKATRQLQDPLNVMTGNFPEWLGELAKLCPFLFPFECRQLNFYLSSFDRDRAIARLQEHQPDLSTADASERVTPKLEKKKRCVSRENILEQAEKILDEMASSRALLEVQYQDEVGTGLGPTLEFYTLVSREVQKSDLNMWWGDPCPLPGAESGASVGGGVTMYVNSPVGLFPAPLGAGTAFSVVEEVCRHFRFLGKFMAKAIMDSRMLDLPLSEAFYQWMLGGEDLFTAQDLQHVDPTVARSYSQLAAVAVKKHALESDPLLSGKALQLGIEALTLEEGGTIEDLDIYFTLPGYDVELKPHGKDIPVTIHNLDEYLKLVLDWTLVTGVARQFDAFKEGFNSVFPLSSLQLFYSHELDLLFCGANHQKWDIKELIEHCRPDHGYTHDSGAIQMLFRVLSTYDTAEQRQFVQFVTGSPRLPVGGFKSLNPPLTIVRKTVDSSSSQSPDEFLPSVMTCVNYLKLPEYSNEQVMRERLYLALREGNHSFHLS